MALTLSRKRGETIVLAGGLIKLTVNAIHGSRVVIGLEAPRDIDIVRGELTKLESEGNDVPSVS